MRSNPRLTGPVGLTRGSRSLPLRGSQALSARDLTLERSKLPHFHKIDAAFPPRLPLGPTRSRLGTLVAR